MSNALKRYPPLKRKSGPLATKLRTARRMHPYYLMLAPVLLYFLLFHYKPMYGLVIAFKDYRMMDGILRSPWAGTKYFSRLFSSMVFNRILRNTIIISLQRIVFGFPAPILLALLVNEIRSVPFRRVVQTVSYLPHFMSWVVLGGIIRELFSPARGVVNLVVTALGGEPIYFLVSTAYFRSVLITTGVWQSIGWGSIVYLAAIAGVNPELYEVARIDGANRFRQAVHITVPSIMPVATVLFLLSLSRILNAGFDQVFNLYNPLVYPVADIIDTYVYRVGLIRFEYSFATAAGLFKNVIGLALVVLVNFVTRRFTEYGLW